MSNFGTMTKSFHVGRAAQSGMLAAQLAGAGMGIDSGLPDFRGPEGFWRAYPALGLQRLGIAACLQVAPDNQQGERPTFTLFLW